MSDITLCHSKVLSMYAWYTIKPEKKLKYYINSLSELDKINKQQCSPICLTKMHTHIANISTNIHTIFDDKTNAEQMDHSLKILVYQTLNIKSVMSDPLGIIHQIDSKVIENLKYAINIALSNKLSNNVIIDAYLKLAQHCLKEFDIQGNNENIHKISLFVESILKSMKYGGKKAWKLFPLILQQNLTNNTLKEIFIKESQGIPEFMYLEWIDQILGCLDSPLIGVFGTLLISIAKMYPKALQYPLRVYMEKDVYKYHETQEFLKTKLYPLVCDNNLDLFINGINNICCPFSQLLEHINCIQKSFRVTCSIAIVFEFKRMFKQCFLTEENKNIKGLEFKKLDCFKNGLQSILDRYSSSNIDQKTAVNELDLIKHNVMEEKKRNYKMLSNEFVHYCPWFMTYSMYCFNSIEVPGQYSGFKMPNPSKHITISSFKSKVLVMYSLRRPIKITIIGSDGIEYGFLVKSNEDLRQDQRIEQLLLLINSILSEEAYCKRQLSVMTYTVVSITSKLGMIEWIDDTVTIKDLISYSITKNDTSGTNRLLENLFNEHYCWLSKKSNSTHSPTIYAQATIEYNNIATIAMFKKLSQSIPTDVLRLSLLSMCHSAEKFICFRSKFITSYSVLSICHWLLGIGDRHLMNTIVSKKTGHCIGIDYNFAFHTATSLQVIPELIPFRMTPHLISLMAPLNVTGFIRETMVSSLNILINNKIILLSVMQVFINEPSIDWIKMAKEEILKIDSDIDLKNIQEWFPKKKILAAKDKMDGVSPVEILKKELESSKVISESYKNALETMLTTNSINNNFKRTLLSKKNITIKQQIDCLLDLATDEHILGKAYGGLELWI